MKKLHSIWLMRVTVVLNHFVILSSLFLAVPTAVAQDAEQKKIYLLPGFPVDANSLNLPDSEMPSKEVWQALICSKGNCNLTVTKLDVQKNESSIQVLKPQIQSGYSTQNTLIYIAGIPVNGKPIVTYFTPTVPRNQLDTSVGTIGTAFNMPTYGLTRILPRWNQEKEDDFMTLYVEQGKRRQAVALISLKSLAKDLKTRDILIWAGDIDGDSKLDLITRNRPDLFVTYSESGEQDSGLNLWLSSKAKKEELVGLASKLDHWETIMEEEY